MNEIRRQIVCDLERVVFWRSDDFQIGQDNLRTEIAIFENDGDLQVCHSSVGDADDAAVSERTAGDVDAGGVGERGEIENAGLGFWIGRCEDSGGDDDVEILREEILVAVAVLRAISVDVAGRNEQVGF